MNLEQKIHYSNLPIFHLITPHWEVKSGFHSCLCGLPGRVPEYRQTFNIKQTKNWIDGTVIKFLGSTISINHEPHT